MQQTTFKKILTGAFLMIASYFYQALNFRQTLLSGTPGEHSDHLWNITFYIIIMIIEFFILFLGYDIVVNIFSINIMSKYRMQISAASLLVTAGSAIMGALIFKKHFIDVINKYSASKKHNGSLSIDSINNTLSSTDHVFYLTLMCALFALSIALFISALMETISLMNK